MNKKIKLPPNTRVSVSNHSLAFKRPAKTSRGSYHYRNVWYIHITSSEDKNHAGVGECAPLDDLSCDASPGYENILKEFCKKLESDGYLDMALLEPYPSMLFGLETAIRHYQANNAVLWDTAFSRGEAGIPINGLIWMGDYEEMLLQIEKKIAAGFRCIKLKIGAIGFDEELALLKHIRKQYPASEIELRVDANGAFSPGDALDKLTKLAALDLHSIEQPIQAGQWEEMRKLTAVTPLPIALDEELIGVHTVIDKQELLDTIRPQYIILKPTLHGGISGCDEWIREAEKRGIGWWITSALESNVGLNAIAQWRSTYDNPLPQGLGTGELFETNKEMYLRTNRDCLWHLADVAHFYREWYGNSPFVKLTTSGSTGIPKEITARKEQMRQSARITCNFLNIQKGDRALLCLPASYIAGKMMIVRSVVGNFDLHIRKPDGHPLANLDVPIDFVALTPMQLYNTLQVPEETERLKEIRIVLVGGGSIDKEIEKMLIDFPNRIFSTYGMTETLSHIALRTLSGKHRSEYYIPFPTVQLSVSSENTLIVEAPHVCDHILSTNDVVELLPDGRFKILGRKDNIINSGGIKIQAEVLEEKLSVLFEGGGYAITSVPDKKMGEAIVLLADQDVAWQDVNDILVKYEWPKYIFRVKNIPLTVSNKTDRKTCKEVALQLVRLKPN